jgi:hypothetical protein
MSWRVASGFNFRFQVSFDIHAFDLRFTSIPLGRELLVFKCDRGTIAHHRATETRNFSSSRRESWRIFCHCLRAKPDHEKLSSGFVGIRICERH